MTVSISDEFCRETLALLTTTWHHHWESFTFKELELLVVVGKLGHIAQAYHPFYLFMSHLYSSLAFALRRIKPSLSTPPNASVHSLKNETRHDPLRHRQ
jgi:hypothetical protein